MRLDLFKTNMCFEKEFQAVTFIEDKIQDFIITSYIKIKIFNFSNQLTVSIIMYKTNETK